MDRLVLLAVVVVATLVLGLWWSRRQGVVRAVRPVAADDAFAAWHGTGVEPAGAVFVQFSAAVCSPCRQTARVLGALAAEVDDVAHVELDVDDHPDLVRRHGVLRTPTVLVLDRTGTEVARSSGAMSPRQAREALALATTGAR
ncbi:thioredoxin [Sediminihabitans luteus]|uniref:Thioredoxin n=1 Tax=Sediminihabitans luteus TaxID=1138585 RepID=A0A2M9CEE4_9CELL|nr:thioredoxin family protein [Sediminihabitans luteus]PJJ70301.1 thioredoxin [Sediminihabitans luteus]GII97772.1 hypothetical protein Slu03_01500 [Sediminihabitans luteus]